MLIKAYTKETLNNNANVFYIMVVEGAQRNKTSTIDLT